ncbi:MAG: PilZ domain-containing protein [Gammaproteobacteria bacterium]|nr:PilZ domain-containing protein [Gammaproteobacteria bacterium]
MSSADDSNNNKRHFTRIPFDARVRIIRNDNSQSWDSELLDISLNGALTSEPDNWQSQSGEAFKLELHLGESDEICMHMNVTVAHHENQRIGFHCEQMDVDTATHLHRLVELNLGDQALLQRELTELLEQHK